MLPIALTCPVWWVARWTARTLATLAVLVACSFGTATLPLGGAAAAPATPTAAASVEGPALRATTAAPALRDAADGPARSAGESRPVAALAPVARTADRPAAVAGAADRPLVLAGLLPDTAGSRAPPAR